MYTFWEFCGEIGGLLEILAIFGSILVTIANVISGSDFDGYLISKLFYFVTENENGRKKAKLNHHCCLSLKGSKLIRKFSKGQ